jgi:hypothetical protein
MPLPCMRPIAGPRRSRERRPAQTDADMEAPGPFGHGPGACVGLGLVCQGGRGAETEGGGGAHRAAGRPGREKRVFPAGRGLGGVARKVCRGGSGPVAKSPEPPVRPLLPLLRPHLLLFARPFRMSRAADFFHPSQQTYDHLPPPRRPPRPPLRPFLPLPPCLFSLPLGHPFPCQALTGGTRERRGHERRRPSRWAGWGKERWGSTRKGHQTWEHALPPALPPSLPSTPMPGPPALCPPSRPPRSDPPALATPSPVLCSPSLPTSPPSPRASSAQGGCFSCRSCCRFLSLALFLFLSRLCLCPCFSCLPPRACR